MWYDFEQSEEFILFAVRKFLFELFGDFDFGFVEREYYTAILLKNTIYLFLMCVMSNEYEIIHFWFWVNYIYILVK